MRIRSKKLIVGRLKSAQRGFGDAPGLLYKFNQLMQSSDNHETSILARMLVRARKLGHFKNLGYPFINLKREGQYVL
tara:strand:- start:2320 stop:2550 length:231 start_codon:yes stop_codon:yes gene_type:complete